jgi:pimeloyl-ACP methyl ester carboxylesterase
MAEASAAADRASASSFRARRSRPRRPSASWRADPAAEASWYEGVGHLPHMEEPERFNRELPALTRRVRA